MSTTTKTNPASPVDHLRFHHPHAQLASTFGDDKFALRVTKELSERIENLTSEMHQHVLNTAPPKS